MRKKITFTVSTDLYEKFSEVIDSYGETIDEAMENCIRLYLAQSCKKISREDSSNCLGLANNNEEFYGKALHRIPMWALKKYQYNHKIIKSYFMAIDIDGEATLTMMERLCSDKGRSDLFVPTFRSNYAQMKIDGPKSHGKVFEDDGNHVWIWDEVKEILMKYKENFYIEEM